MRSIFTSLIFLSLSWLMAICSVNPTSIFSLVKVAFAYGTFFYALLYLKCISQRIWVTGVWSITLTMYNLSWLISDAYIGRAIHYVWFFLSFLIGIQFILFILVFFKCLERFSQKIVFILVPFFWVFLENIRYKYLFCGCSWDLIGIALSYHKYSTLLAGFLGVSGLSLFTIVIAIAWFNCLKGATWRNFAIWSSIFIFPFLLGSGIYNYYQRQFQRDSKNIFSIALIQPNFAPIGQGSVIEEIENRWARIIHLFSLIDKKVSLIILPETIFPYNATSRFLSSEKLNSIFYRYLHITPFENKNRLSHLEVLLVLSRYYNSDILVGLERKVFFQKQENKSYNSAFLITHDGEISFYDKRLLVPIGEYFPGGSLGYKIGSKYFGLYTISHGKKQLPLSGSYTPKFGVSICYEETFSYILQKYKKQKAEFLVNLTNDVWYPKSRLPYEHFIHGRLRGIELGLPYIRVCNTGVTGAWDSLGNTVGFLPYESKKNEAKEGIIFLKLPLCSYPTFYSLVGDSLLNSFSCLAFFIVFGLIFFKPKLFLKKTI